MQENTGKKWILPLTAGSSLLILIGLYITHLILYPACFVFKEHNLPDNIYYEYGDHIELPQLQAYYRGVFSDRFGKDVSVRLNGTYDPNKIGTYPLAYQATNGKETISFPFTLHVEDHTAPVLSLNGDSDVILRPIDTYTEEGFTATDNYDGDLSASVIREESKDLITYKVSDSSGNTTELTRKITYVDSVAPVLTLVGEAKLTQCVNESYTEPGCTAIDDCEGDITTAVNVSGTVDTTTLGQYTLTYTATDSYGNSSSITREVTVADTKKPVISLTNPGTTYILLGSNYQESGYRASDNYDGDLTSKVTVSGNVDTSAMGQYKLQYSVTDSSGNTATATRNVYVYEKQATSATVNPGDKIVYLTFDDGPSCYTEKLLDILDKYNVKATFFVTAQSRKYENMIGEAYRRGHSIALHTYSHQWASVYSSAEAYYNDLEKIQDIVVRQTGQRSTLVRFPGGTSNTKSRRYCKGLMTFLSKDLGYRGYRYCDWNVSSGDAGGTTSKDQVVRNVINGIKRHNISWVLQHDIKKFSVDAVEEIILWGLANGYTFLAMDENSPVTQQNPNN